MILAATGVTAAVGGKISQSVVDTMHQATIVPPMEPAAADAVQPMFII